MNKDRSSRTTSNISPNSHPHFFIQNSEIAYADITFVEKVLAILIESRFGPGFEYQKLEKPSNQPDFEPVLFSDLLDADELSVSFWDARSCRRCESPHVSKGDTHNIDRHALAHAQACAHSSGTHHTQAGCLRSDNSLGRGSP